MISRQYPFGTDKAVQISRTACCDKGTQPKYTAQQKFSTDFNLMSHFERT